MPELQDVLIVAGLVQRGDLVVAEGGVGAVDDVLEVGGGNRVSGDEQRENLVG